MAAVNAAWSSASRVVTSMKSVEDCGVRSLAGDVLAGFEEERLVVEATLLWAKRGRWLAGVRWSVGVRCSAGERCSVCFSGLADAEAGLRLSLT